MHRMGLSTSGKFANLLDKATSHLQLEPNWPTIIQICNLITQGDTLPKNALTCINKKIVHENPHTALFGLLVLESCMKNCGALIHDEVCTKQYMEQLKEVVKSTKQDQVKSKILELMQAWAFAFRNNPKYRAVQDIVHILKAENYTFPTLKESDAMFSSNNAPVWVDGEVCHRCRVTFTVIQRKHHCRACGQVFCAACSGKLSVLPKFGIEKEVRVCDTCYDSIHKPSSSTSKETDLPAEYLSSSLAQQQQVPPRKTDEELREEEELQLALVLSQSEAEHKEKEKKRATSAIRASAAAFSKATYSPPSSPGPSPSRIQDEDDEPEMAKYMNREYWEQRHSMLEEQNSRTSVTSPSAPNISSPMPQKVIAAKEQNGEIDTQMEAFVKMLKSNVEIFVNRMKSDSSRGRSIANDSSVQNLFGNITNMHSMLLRHIQDQEDKRVRFELLQDKLVQIKDARAALDDLRAEHRDKLRQQAEEAERQRQQQMAQKLEIMRKKKQEYLQYQHELMMQRMEEEKREMQMRQEQQKQQYMMGSYQAVSGFMGGPPTQGSPVRHVQYPQAAGNIPYNGMSPTNQGVYGYPPVGMSQYPMPGYGMPQQPHPMSGHQPRMMETGPGTMEQTPADPSVQARESLGRVTVSGPGMQMPPMAGAPSQPMPPGHKGPPPGMMPHMGMVGQPPPGHMMQPPVGPNPMGGAVQIVPNQMLPRQPMMMPGQNVVPGQIAQQQHAQQPHGPGANIPVPGAGQMLTSNGPMPNTQSVPTMPGGLQPMQAPAPVAAQGPSMPFQPPAKEDPKPDTAELISFD